MRLLCDGLSAVDNLLNFIDKDICSGCQVLDRLENNSRTVKGSNLIGQDNEALSVILLPLKNLGNGSQNSCRYNLHTYDLNVLKLFYAF